jgi:UDP-3-O-[3-hydroxymyristoyl] glucosamine N-acyltransferase
MSFTVDEVARHLQGEVVGDGSIMLTGFAPADRAGVGDLTFAENAEYLARAERGAASAIILEAEVPSSKTLIKVRNARVAFARALSLFFPEPVFPPGIHSTALIDSTARVDPSAHIGPHCVLGPGVKVGPRCVLQGGNHLGADCVLGEDVTVFPNVTFYPRSEIGNRVRIHSGSVIGSDGFGYVQDNGIHRKVPQVGNVVIKDDVEIGANVAIDRGALGPTVIGKGTKVDNLVQIAHNVVIGDDCLVISQVGIAGSTQVGNRSILAGQVGLAGHLRIGNGVSIAAQSGVMNHVPDGEKWLGSPAQPDRQMKRQLIALQHLPELLRRVSELERKIEAAEAPASHASGAAKAGGSL